MQEMNLSGTEFNSGRDTTPLSRASTSAPLRFNSFGRLKRQLLGQDTVVPPEQSGRQVPGLRGMW